MLGFELVVVCGLVALAVLSPLIASPTCTGAPNVWASVKSHPASGGVEETVSIVRIEWNQSGAGERTRRDGLLAASSGTQAQIPGVDASKAHGADDAPLKPPKSKGDRLGPFDIKDLAGHRWTDEQLKGKTVIAVVWDTRCGFCHPLLRDLQTLYKRLEHDKRFVVISFSLDEDVEYLASFVREKSYTFPVLPAQSLLKWSAVPSTWICDRDGVIRRDMRGYSSQHSAWWAQEVVDAAEKCDRRPSSTHERSH